MNWTNEKPTKPGWYWWREDNAVVWLIYIYSAADGRMGCDCYRPKRARLRRPIGKYLTGQFAGPIPEPTEPSIFAEVEKLSAEYLTKCFSGDTGSKPVNNPKD